jgi:hypothetical protein
MVGMNTQRKPFGMTDLKSTLFNSSLNLYYRSNGFFDWYANWSEIKPQFKVIYWTFYPFFLETIPLNQK